MLLGASAVLELVGDGTTSVSSTSIAVGVAGACGGWGGSGWASCWWVVLATFEGTEAGGGMLGVSAVSFAKIWLISSKSWVPGRRRAAWMSLGAARNLAARFCNWVAKSSAGPSFWLLGFACGFSSSCQVYG